MLDSQPVSRVLSFLYQNVFHRPFILSPDLVSDPRLVSFHVTQNFPLRSFFITWLNRNHQRKRFFILPVTAA